MHFPRCHLNFLLDLKSFRDISVWLDSVSRFSVLSWRDVQDGLDGSRVVGEAGRLGFGDEVEDGGGGDERL